MNILLLGGQAVINKEWIHNLVDKLNGEFDNIVVLDYLHWQEGTEHCKIDLEIERINEIVKDWDKYMIFAKSIGTILTTKAMYETKLSKLPVCSYFVGYPYTSGKQMFENIEEMISTINTPTHIEQKRVDPVCSYQQLSTVLGKIGNEKISYKEYEYVDESDDNHHYANLDTLKNKIIELRDKYESKI